MDYSTASTEVSAEHQRMGFECPFSEQEPTTFWAVFVKSRGKWELMFIETNEGVARDRLVDKRPASLRRVPLEKIIRQVTVSLPVVTEG